MTIIVDIGNLEILAGLLVGICAAYWGFAKCIGLINRS